MECECNFQQDDICPNCGQHASSGKRYIQLGRSLTRSTSPKSPDAILPELSQLQLTDEIKIEISRLYAQVTVEKSRRNGPRKAIIYCCIIAVCKEHNLTFDSKSVQIAFDITQKQINSAMKHLGTKLNFRQLDVNIEDLLLAQMKLLNIQSGCLADIVEIYKMCLQHSPVFNSSKADTLAAGLLFYYLQKNLEGFNADAYFGLSKISKDSILLITSEIAKILQV